MSAPGIPGLRRAVRWLRGQHAEWVVLLYHRVANVRCDPWGLAVTPQHFQDAQAKQADRLAIIA